MHPRSQSSFMFITAKQISKTPIQSQAHWFSKDKGKSNRFINKKKKDKPQPSVLTKHYPIDLSSDVYLPKKLPELPWPYGLLSFLCFLSLMKSSAILPMMAPPIVPRIPWLAW